MTGRLPMFSAVTVNRMVKAHKDGATLTDLGARFGCNANTVREYLRAAGVDTSWQAKRRRPSLIAVPAWVPPPLIATYVAHAKQHGEEEAASVVRRLKQSVRSNMLNAVPRS